MEVFPILLYVAAWVIALITSINGIDALPNELIKYLLFLSVGLQGLWAFIGHCFYANEAAKKLGWKESPFQQKVGYASLGLAISGLLCLGYNDLWLATSIIASVYYLGSAYTSYREMLKKKVFKTGHAGPIFYAHIAVPLTLWVALYYNFLG